MVFSHQSEGTMPASRFTEEAPVVSLADGQAFGKQHLEGLRRGVLFLLAVGTAVFLFASVGWENGEASAHPQAQAAGIVYCPAGDPSCGAYGADDHVAQIGVSP
jgi:hypothetical protein